MKKKKYGNTKKSGVEDLELLLKSLNQDDTVIRTAFGEMTFDSLEEKDVGKHGAVFVSYSPGKMPQVFFNKKFDGGRNKKIINDFNAALLQSERDFAHLIPRGEFITAELMNQNRAYTQSSDPGPMVVLHGSILIMRDDLPQELFTFDGMEQLCDAYKMEGFVCVCRETGQRYKLKRCCFLSGKNHGTGPSLEDGDFTESGLQLCDNGQSGYHTAALAKVCKSQVIASKIISGHKTNLMVIPNEDAVRKQLLNPFDGEKMLNLYQTTGSGDSYRYIDACRFMGSFENMELQKKFDGETVLLHNDSEGRFHLLIRFNVDALRVVPPDGGAPKVRFGWKK